MSSLTKKHSYAIADVLSHLASQLPAVSFVAHDTSFWSPVDTTVYFQQSDDPRAIWTLLHETGHAALNHTHYESDFELLLLEVAAWEQAKQLADFLNVVINEDHIQDCLETYRDWLHQRSTCPRCGIRCFQKDVRSYLCHNCQAQWQVSASRFCRSYRLSKLKTPAPARVQQTAFV